MNNDFTPFWDEGMDTEERSRRVSLLFDMLEHKLDLVAHKEIDASGYRTFVFIPDPPPWTFDLDTRELPACLFTWGVKGRGKAMATESKQAAAILAPYMIDLWASSLFILVFKAPCPDGTTLGQWVNKVLQVKSDAPSGIILPAYALLTFDSGDLVNDSLSSGL